MEDETQANFLVVRSDFEAVLLSMYLPPPSAAPTPKELTDFWEAEWGVRDAGRIKFKAPKDFGSRWLSHRGDSIPLTPEVLTLECPRGAGSVLASLVLAFERHASAEVLRNDGGASGDGAPETWTPQELWEDNRRRREDRELREGAAAAAAADAAEERERQEREQAEAQRARSEDHTLGEPSPAPMPRQHQHQGELEKAAEGYRVERQTMGEVSSPGGREQMERLLENRRRRRELARSSADGYEREEDRQRLGPERRKAEDKPQSEPQAKDVEAKGLPSCGQGRSADCPQDPPRLPPQEVEADKGIETSTPLAHEGSPRRKEEEVEILSEVAKLKEIQAPEHLSEEQKIKWMQREERRQRNMQRRAERVQGLMADVEDSVHRRR